MEQQQQRQKKAWEDQQQLVCPRCNSNKTRFCYYNNHSTLQPRYFCRECRRHWTAGGKLHDVPEGGTKRGKRNPSSRPGKLPYGSPSGMDNNQQMVQVIAGDVSTDQNFIFMMQSLVAASGSSSSNYNVEDIRSFFRSDQLSSFNHCELLYGYSSSSVRTLDPQELEVNWCHNLLMVQQAVLLGNNLVQQRTNHPPPPLDVEELTEDSCHPSPPGPEI